MRQNLYSAVVLMLLSTVGPCLANEIGQADCILTASGAVAQTEPALSGQDVLKLLQSSDPALSGQALQALNQAAASSQPWALRQLASLYQTGSLVEASPDCTRRLLSDAAQTGDVTAKLELASLLLGGTPTPDDVAQAGDMLDEAATSDDPWTLINIANTYTTGTGVAVDARKAIALYERAAALHNDAALVQLGALYRTGLGDVAADLAKAAAYFAQAADSGNNAARVNLALMLMAGTPVSDDSKALDLLKAAVADQDVWASTILASIYTQGKLLPADGEAAIGLLTPLADAGNFAALTGLGDVYAHGAGTIPADPAMALSYYERAAAGGDLGAKNKLGLMLVDPQGPGPDAPRGVRLLEEVADAGDGWANIQVGDIYAQGKVVAIDADKAMRRYQQAAAAGVPAGLVRLSGLYKSGLGDIKADPRQARDYLEQAVALDDNTGRVLLALDLVAQARPEDTARALDLLQAAADTGDAWASTLLASYYVEGSKVPADGAKVIALLQPLADQHQPAAIAGLGDLYRKGAGDIAADPRKALDYYQTAADLGDLGAKNKLGLMLTDPASPAPDAPRGLALLKEVAEHGDGWAMIQTGDVLASGQGVPLDAEQAVSYFKRAADAGISAGYVRLGGVYQKGLGTVAADAEAARGYYRKAIAQDDNTARISLALMLLDSSRKSSQNEAVALLEDAADRDSVWALTILTDLYSSGRSRTPDYRLAMRSYERLVELGQPAAKLQFGLSLITGPLSDAHAAQGVSLVRQAVDEHVPNAMAEFARLQSIGKIRGDDGRDAERNLLAEVEAGNPTALRYLLQLYRSGGEGLRPQLAKARDLFAANRDLLKLEDAAFEAISLTAMQSPTQTNMSQISRSFAQLRSSDMAQALQVLFWVNKNAYVYVVQEQMKRNGQYQGRVSGLLTKQTISAIRVLCERAATRQQCDQGPLAPSNAVAVSNYLAAS